MIFCPRRCPGPAGFFEARFAPRSLQTLAAPFRGAKSSHNSRASPRGRPAFSRRGLLPAPCKPLRLRSGEQNLHTIPALPPGAGRLFRSAVCSPLPANPCGSVPGSKIFTQFPRHRSGPAGFFPGAVCSPLPARPCSSVWGSKFFTQFPRRPSKNPRSTFCFGDFSFTFIFFYLSISTRWDSGVWK